MDEGTRRDSPRASQSVADCQSISELPSCGTTDLDHADCRTLAWASKIGRGSKMTRNERIFPASTSYQPEVSTVAPEIFTSYKTQTSRHSATALLISYLSRMRCISLK